MHAGKKSLRNLLIGAAVFNVISCAPDPALEQKEIGQTCAPPDDRQSEIFVKGGNFMLGDDRYYREEGPPIKSEVLSFWIDTTEVTNTQFEAFVNATGYITQAEKGFDPETFPGIVQKLRQPGSLVFTPPSNSENSSPNIWWKFIPGANWRHPLGPESSIEDKERYPVVHMTHADAAAYAKWAGRRLPSEAEWEFAATIGEDPNTQYSESTKTANSWQGAFPAVNTKDDGYEGVAPVGCFPKNNAGAYDMIGNVWELTSSAYFPNHEQAANSDLPKTGFDPRQAGVPVNVIKGGSFLCADNYCIRYRPSARQAQDAFLPTSHIGFRTVRDQ